MRFLYRANATLFFTLIVNILSPSFVLGQNPDAELKLRKDLFLNHTNVIRPVANISLPVEINATLQLFKIVDFDTVNGILVTQCSLELNWYDEFLAWDPEKYANISMIYVSAKEIWKPKIIVPNSATEHSSDSEDNNLELHSDGSVVSWYQDILRTFCKVDALSYPFDKQHCKILIGVAVQKTQHITIKQLYYHKASFFRNFVWDVEMRGIGKSLDNAGRSMTKATIYLSRKIRMTTIATMVPSAIFTIVSAFVFLLPTESGERVSLATTLLLSNIVYLVQMDQIAPKNSQSMPLITVYILILTIWSGFNTIGAIIESKMYFTKEMNNNSVRRDDKRVKAVIKKKRSNQVSGISQDNYSYVENEIQDINQKADSSLVLEEESEENNDVIYKQQNTKLQKTSLIFLGIGLIYIIISIIALILKASIN